MIKVITDDILTLKEEDYNRDVILGVLENSKEAKLGILRNGKIIKVLTYDDIYSGRKVREKCLLHSERVFEEALAEYNRYEEKEGRCIPVYNGSDSLEYILQYGKNRVDDNEESYVEEYLSYDINDENMDFDLLNRADTFIFYELEEYTYQIARIILKHFPEKQVFFTDLKVRMFFREEDVAVAAIEQIYLKHIGTGMHSIMMIDSNKDFGPHNPLRFLFKTYHSLEVMTSLFWSCHRTSFGDRNADKTFFWIHSPLGAGHGFTDLIKYPLFKAIMARSKGIIPVIDLSVKDDDNVFSHGNGDNVWEYYMEQPFDVSVEEVLESKNVIVHDGTIMDRFNPFSMEVEYFIDWGEMLDSYLKLNAETQDYIDAQCDKYIKKGEKVLGVIAHPPHYGIGVYEFMEPVSFLEIVQTEFLNGGYDKLFLNTENQEIYEMFMGSDIGNKIVYVSQKRTKNEDFLIDGKYVSGFDEDNLKTFTRIIAAGEDSYERERRYLSVIYILSKCDMLMASGSCGGFRLAHALHKGNVQKTWVYNG